MTQTSVTNIDTNQNNRITRLSSFSRTSMPVQLNPDQISAPTDLSYSCCYGGCYGDPEEPPKKARPRARKDGKDSDDDDESRGSRASTGGGGRASKRSGVGGGQDGSDQGQGSDKSGTGAGSRGQSGGRSAYGSRDVSVGRKTADGQTIPYDEDLENEKLREWRPGIDRRWPTSICYPPTHYEWKNWIEYGKCWDGYYVMSAIEAWSYFTFDSEYCKDFHYDS